MQQRFLQILLDNADIISYAVRVRPLCGDIVNGAPKWEPYAALGFCKQVFKEFLDDEFKEFFSAKGVQTNPTEYQSLAEEGYKLDFNWIGDRSVYSGISIHCKGLQVVLNKLGEVDYLKEELTYRAMDNLRVYTDRLCYLRNAEQVKNFFTLVHDINDTCSFYVREYGEKFYAEFNLRMQVFLKYVAAKSKKKCRVFMNSDGVQLCWGAPEPKGTPETYPFIIMDEPQEEIDCILANLKHTYDDRIKRWRKYETRYGKNLIKP